MGIGNDMVNLAKQAAKNVAKNYAKKIGKIILKSPAFWTIIGIMIFIFFILAIFSDIEISAADVEDTYSQIPTGWWWPIGSEETITEGNDIYAAGIPVECVITSGVGPRWGKSHNGIDIAPNGGGNPPGPYIVSAGMGRVTYAIDGFSDNGYYGNTDGGSFGNHVIVDYGDGITITYGHLSKGTVKVETRR